MKIIKYKMICPKCKREYFNESLMSFSSGFEDAAKNFADNNKVTTVCDQCNTWLVPEELINNFDNEGNYFPITKEIEIIDDTYNLYLDIVKVIKDFFRCIPNGKIQLTAKIIDNNDKINTFFNVIGINENVKHKLLNVMLDEYFISNNNRRDKFSMYCLVNEVNVFISNIYEFLFVDEYNTFKENKESITSELININDL